MALEYRCGVPYLLPNGRVSPEWSQKHCLAHKDRVGERTHTYHLANKEKLLASSRQRHPSHKVRDSKLQRERSFEIERRAVLKTNGKIVCAVDGCGCNDLAILQANHISGGHTKPSNKGMLPTGGLPLYHEIASGRVDAELFSFLCPPHNAIDHLERVRDKFVIRRTS